jgi:hypothetical protein
MFCVFIINSYNTTGVYNKTTLSVTSRVIPKGEMYMNIISAGTAILRAIPGFKSRHPMVINFISGFKYTPIQTGAIVEVTVTNPDGSRYKTNMRVGSEDLADFYDIVR